MPLQTTLKLVPTARDLRVQLVVHNPSKRYELFDQMSCSWDRDWRCDRSGIILAPRACAKNTPRTIILPPGESFREETWPLWIRGVKPRTVTFRLGLLRSRTAHTSDEIEEVYRSTTRRNDFSPFHNRYTGQKEIFWSNRVTVSLRREWLSGYRPEGKV